MLAMASCLFYYYYHAGRFRNTYEELEKDIEGRNEKAVEDVDTFQLTTTKADSLKK